MAIELTEQDLKDSLTHLANFGAMVVDGKATAGGLRATARWLSQRKGQRIYHKTLADRLKARFGEQYDQALCNRGVAPILKEYVNSSQFPESVQQKIADWMEENSDRIVEFDHQHPDLDLDTATQERNTLKQHNWHRRRIKKEGIQNLINALEAGENTAQAAASVGVSQATASRYRELLKSC